MRIAILGSGGVGGYFGGRLAQSGNDVTFIARGGHLRALRSTGLRVDSINGDYTSHEKNRAETSARAPLDALDQLSRAVSDDLEWPADLLGQQRISDWLRKFHVISVLPRSLFQFSGSRPSSR